MATLNHQRVHIHIALPCGTPACATLVVAAGQPQMYLISESFSINNTQQASGHQTWLPWTQTWLNNIEHVNENNHLYMMMFIALLDNQYQDKTYVKVTLSEATKKRLFLFSLEVNPASCRSSHLGNIFIPFTGSTARMVQKGVWLRWTTCHVKEETHRAYS